MADGGFMSQQHVNLYLYYMLLFQLLRFSIYISSRIAENLGLIDTYLHLGLFAIIRVPFAFARVARFLLGPRETSI